MMQDLDIEEVGRVWKSLTGSLTSYFDEMKKAIDSVVATYWPMFSAMQRENTRRIHSQYRRKQMSRRRRNRKR